MPRSDKYSFNFTDLEWLCSCCSNVRLTGRSTSQQQEQTALHEQVTIDMMQSLLDIQTRRQCDTDARATPPLISATMLDSSIAARSTGTVIALAGRTGVLGCDLDYCFRSAFSENPVDDVDFNLRK